MYIQRSLESDYDAHLPLYRAGLQAVGAHAHALHHHPFRSLASKEQDAVLRDVEKDRAGADGRQFFKLVWQHSLEGMFRDPSWDGNRGYAGWRLLDYPGARLEWRSEDQHLDEVSVPVWEKEGGNVP
jgi:gluconate 2-dehydrogenase gamma chain